MNLGLLCFKEGNPEESIEHYLDCLEQGVSDKYKKLHKTDLNNYLNRTQIISNGF